MPQDTRMTLCLLEQLIKALRANDPVTFKGWLSGGVQDLGEAAVTELLMNWMTPLLTVEEKDRLIAWHLVMRFLNAMHESAFR